MKTLPKMVPVYPTKDSRITLNPVEIVALYQMVEGHLEVFDQIKNPTDHQKFALLVYERIEEKLSDKLDFKTVN